MEEEEAAEDDEEDDGEGPAKESDLFKDEDKAESEVETAENSS